MLMEGLFVVKLPFFQANNPRLQVPGYRPGFLTRTGSFPSRGNGEASLTFSNDVRDAILWSCRKQKFSVLRAMLHEWSGLRLLRGAVLPDDADARLVQDQAQ